MQNIKCLIALYFTLHNGWTELLGSAMLAVMARLSVRIDFEPSGSALGPGMAELLERVGRLGSIRQAAASMDMSYRKAWLLLKGMQQTFGGAVVVTETGGAAGGGAQLTELGHRLIKSYRAIQLKAARATADEVKLLSALVRDSAPPKRRVAPKGS
jgi:molybdate transport system regulatory protein